MGRFVQLAEEALQKVSTVVARELVNTLTNDGDDLNDGNSRCERSELCEISPVASEPGEEAIEFRSEEFEIAQELEEITNMREKGRVPDHYTAQTECKHCGPVPIWEGCASKVLGCPWCFNRHASLPMPNARRAR